MPSAIALALALATAPQGPASTPAAIGEILEPGTIVQDVRCLADPTQGYALYLPKTYTRDRAWPIILGFDPGGRGRNPVERYQLAADTYGYIVAGSNNSRNGSSDTTRAVSAMSADLAARFRVDTTRVYTAGMSGGARVAVGVALVSSNVAAVIASSAGLPDGQPRKALRFPIFMTAGTEDFNHLEMRTLDRALTTPHRLVVFDGGHQWLSPALALEGVEWLELQAMKTGLKPKDEGEIAAILAKRAAALAGMEAPGAIWSALGAIVQDFQGLSDVSEFARRADALAQDKQVRDAVQRDREEDDRELKQLMDVRSAEARLAVVDERAGALLDLQAIWKSLAERAGKPADSADRRLARRLLSALTAGTSTSDADYQRIIGKYGQRPGQPTRQ